LDFVILFLLHLEAMWLLGIVLKKNKGLKLNNSGNGFFEMN